TPELRGSLPADWPASTPNRASEGTNHGEANPCLSCEATIDGGMCVTGMTLTGMVAVRWAGPPVVLMTWEMVPLPPSETVSRSWNRTFVIGHLESPRDRDCHGEAGD